MPQTQVVARGTAAFGAQWQLHSIDEDGYWAIVREWTGRDSYPGALPSRKRSVQYFDNETDARQYFAQYTTPIIAVEAR